jgi:hypothetical protein
MSWTDSEKRDLISAFNSIAAGLENISASIDNLPELQIDNCGIDIERGLCDVAIAIGNLEINK